MKKLFSLVFILTAVAGYAQNIGIGTNTPNNSAQLDVESSSRGLLIPRMTTPLRNAIASPAQGLLVFDSTEKSFFFRRGNFWQRIYDNASPIFPNAYAGSWPANLILSLENTSISTGSSIPVIYSVNRGAGPGVWGSSETGNGVRGTSGGQYGVYGESADSIGGYFTSTSGKAALVTGNGNVGIGVNYPYQAKFVVASNLTGNSMAVIGQGTGGVSFRAGGSPSIGFNAYTVAGVNRFMSASGYAGVVDFVPSNGDLIFKTTNATSGGTDQSAAAATQTMMLTRTGQLGVGNITPAYTLDVNGRARFRHNTITSGLWLNKSDNTEGSFIGMVNDTTAGFWGNATSGNWKMVVDVKNAMVGIGTSDPVSPLSFANASGNKISVWSNPNGSQYGLGLQGGLLQIYSDASTSDIAFGYGNSTSFTENVRIKGNGNVGIGIDNPGFRLVVESGGVGIVQQSPDGGTRVGFYTSAGSAFVQTHSNHSLNFSTNNGGAHMTITPAGNIGIGTQSPIVKFDVNGGARFSQKIQLNQNNGAGNTEALEVNGRVLITNTEAIVANGRSTFTSNTEALVANGRATFNAPHVDSAAMMVNGPIRVGGSNASAFIYVPSVSDFSVLASSGIGYEYLTINHPVLNNNPNALLFLQPLFISGATLYGANFVPEYNGGTGRWQIRCRFNKFFEKETNLADGCNPGSDCVTTSWVQTRFEGMPNNSSTQFNILYFLR